jgi:hypothetical protein
MTIVVSDGIVVSGVGVPLNGIAWPSGQFAYTEPGSQLCAFLSSVNASFGFNLTPHSFQTEWVPCGDPCAFHGASGQLPDIGHSLELFVGDFFLRGKVTHADYTSSAGGTIMSVTVEDDRRTLRKVKIHTEDLGEDAPSGVISVARGFRIINGLEDVNGNPSDPNIKEYRRILQFGGTYSQILAAIDLHFNEGKCAVPVTDLPSVEKLEKNIGGTIEAIRFQFNLTNLDEALSRILLDTGYDWYWNMDAQQVNLINKKSPFDISEADILELVSEFGSASGLNETKQIGFGQDVVPDPTRFRVLGGHQEGFINSHVLSPIDGLDTFDLDGITDIDTVQSGVVFTPAWRNLSIGFYDGDGFYRTYMPLEKELQLALAGIEQWTYYKIYQTASPSDDPPGWGYPPDAGSIAAQHPAFQSRLDPVMPLASLATGNSLSGIRVISNRRDQEQNWILAFYGRVRDHAARHYGRSYVLEGLLFDTAQGLYRLVDAAWANVENQVEGFTLSTSGTVVAGGSGIFVEDYEINRDLGPVSPFVTDDFRVSAHCRLPRDTVYGPQGVDSPASFGNWTEDAPPFNPDGDGSHFIPVELTIVGNRVINPRSDELYSFEAYPEGTIWCQLPINAGPSGGLVEDSIIRTLATLLTTQTKLTGSGLRDLINPAIVLNAYDALSGVAIPVESRNRYGQSYPSQWVIGDLHYERDEDVQLDDQFVPWAFSPEGSETSLQIMGNRAIRRAEGKIVPRSSARYADFDQVGLPLLSFDAFAQQNIGPSGLYGEISHGVNEMNISFGIDGFATRYKIQSYYPKFGREAPLGERVRAILNGILNPIDFSDLALLDPTPPPPTSPNLPGDPFLPPTFFDDEQRAVRVTITEINNIFTLFSDPLGQKEERYRGLDVHRYKKPHAAGASTNPDFKEGAICIDGFLNIGDEALYHTDEFELPTGNTVLRYFTQGRPFGNGTIVQVQQINADDATKYDVTIVDPTTLATVGDERAILGVEVLNGSVAIGDKTTLAVQGDGPVSPGASDGTIFINGTAQDAAGVTAVEIISVSNGGSATARAVCREIGLAANGSFVVTSGELFYNVVPMPFPEFAASGDRGFLATSSATPSGGFGNSGPVSFVEIVRPALRRYG